MLSLNSIALDVAGLSFQFGSQYALEEVTFTIRSGTFNVLLGLNGAGKTTLFSLVTGLYHPEQGRIRVMGYDLAAEPGPALKHIGVVFQSPSLDLGLTINQNLRYHAALHGLGDAEAQRRITTSLERHGLADHQRKKVSELSNGQRRRVELARALLHQPKLLLLDEATVGLDIHSRREFIDQVRALCSQGTVGVLWATHLIDEVDADDRVIVLHAGRVVRSGVVREIVSGLGAQNIDEAFTMLSGQPR